MDTSMVLADGFGSLGLPVVNVERRLEEDGRTTGMWVSFANGMTLSIQWGTINYSNVGRGFWRPGDDIEVEAAAWYPDELAPPSPWGGHEYYTEPGWCDVVLPYVTIAQVADFARKVAALDADTVKRLGA